VDSIRANTGFEFDVAGDVPVTPPPAPEDLALLRGDVAPDIAETYPRFARTLFGASAAAE
jgi:hypothetical protein